MIASHNIKVNGRWILAGQEYEPEEKKAPVKAEPAAEPEAPVKEPEKKEEAKPKSTARRKKVSE